MAGLTFESIFYDMVLPNSAAGAVFILLILVFRLVTKRWSKGYVRILWVLLLACLLAPPLFHGSFYTVRNLGMDSRAADENQSSHLKGQASGRKTESFLSEASPEQMHTAENQWMQNQQNSMNGQTGKSENSFSEERQAAQQGSIYVPDQVKTWGAVIWLAGACVLALLDLYQYVRLRKKMSDAVFVYGQECGSLQRTGTYNRITDKAAASMHGYWVSGQTDVPFVMPGVVPRIYLPCDIACAQMADILAHERQHIKNFDPVIKCIAAAALAVYWFHPLVWLAVSLMGKDMEMYCDECVLRGKSMEERKAYSGTLLEYAAHASGLSFTMYFGESNIGNRIRHILRVKKPRRMVSLLLAVFIGISGVLFLSSRNIEAEMRISQTSQDKTSKAESAYADQHNADQYNADINNADKSDVNKGNADTGDIKAENVNSTGSQKKDGADSAYNADIRSDPYKFAEEIIRLVKAEKKNELAQLIHFPIRIEIDAAEVYVQNKTEFVENYDKIANERWKNAVLGTDISQMISNYMGYGMGNGEIWFSKIDGQEGWWIYAVNNAQEPDEAEEGSGAGDDGQSLQEEWQQLAAVHGMTNKEARRWYARFRQDDLQLAKNNMHITGCAYEDFDGNGEKDLFFVASVMPDEIYSESVPFTMCVYGYLNGVLSYQNGSLEFSRDGFLECEAQPVSETGIGCRIRYTVDTDSLEEQPHLVDFDTQGNFMKEQLPGESEKFVRMLAQIPHEEYGNALDLEKILEQMWNSDGRSAYGKSAYDGQIVSLYEDAREDLYVYAYFMKNYHSRGTVIRYKGNYSYFDRSICGDYGYAAPSVYFEDIDSDREKEIVCIYLAGHGTGISVGGLTVFDIQQDHTIAGYEIEESDQLQQVGKFIHFDEEHGKILIQKDGRTKKEIDLTASPDYEEHKDTIEVNYSNNYYYEMKDGRIKLKVEVTGAIGFLWYMEDVEDSLTEFDVLFEDGKFYID